MTWPKKAQNALLFKGSFKKLPLIYVKGPDSSLQFAIFKIFRHSSSRYSNLRYVSTSCPYISQESIDQTCQFRHFKCGVERETDSKNGLILSYIMNDYYSLLMQIPTGSMYGIFAYLYHKINQT